MLAFTNNVHSAEMLEAWYAHLYEAGNRGGPRFSGPLILNKDHTYSFRGDWVKSQYNSQCVVTCEIRGKWRIMKGGVEFTTSYQHAELDKNRTSAHLIESLKAAGSPDQLNNPRYNKDVYVKWTRSKVGDTWYLKEEGSGVFEFKERIDNQIHAQAANGGVWSPGRPHQSAPNVVAGPKPGNWRPAPGYQWMSNAPNDLRTAWVPGSKHPDYPHVIAAQQPGRWVAASRPPAVSSGSRRSLLDEVMSWSNSRPPTLADMEGGASSLMRDVSTIEQMSPEQLQRSSDVLRRQVNREAATHNSRMRRYRMNAGQRQYEDYSSNMKADSFSDNDLVVPGPNDVDPSDY
jgi:hypothetical protein